MMRNTLTSTERSNASASKLVPFLSLTLLALGCGGGATSESTTPIENKTDKPAEKAMPTADEVLARYVEVTGGEAAHRAFKGMKASGKFEIPGQGINGPLTMVVDGPKVLVTIEIKGLGVIQQGSDGTTVWETNPMMGARVLDGAERQRFVRDNDPLRDVEWKRFYKSATVTGAEDFEGKKVHVVEMVDLEGATETRYYDSETGFLVFKKETLKTQGGDVPSEVRFSDYAAFDNMTQPKRMEQKTATGSLVAIIETVEINPTIEAATFELPADVQAVVKAKAAP